MRRTPTQATQAEPVRPSTRDPIAQWLDVFTSLLALPASEADRIRDELEDHLRTRVDDLLILGMTEPEAVQKAVTELGETAQLARNFRSVRTHSRRRIAMHTALFAAVGFAISVSVAGLIPRSPSPAFAPIATIQPEETGLKSLGLDLNGGTLEETLNAIAEATGARLFVHWNALEDFSNLTRDSELGPIPAKDLDGAKILELMNSMLNLSDEGVLAVRHEGNLVEVANVAYFDRIETVTMDYDVSLLVGAGHVLMVTDQGLNLVNNIEKIVEPRVWQNNGGEATLTMSGSLLTVRAPKRIHTMVGPYIAKLELIERERAEREAQAERADRERGAEALKDWLIKSGDLLLNYESQLTSQMNDLDSVNAEYWRSEYAKTELETAYQSAEGEEARAEALDELARWGAEFESLVMRRDTLRDAVMDTRKNIQLMRSNMARSQAQMDSMASAPR